MEKAKKIIMTISLVVLIIALGASVWLYSVSRDAMSLAILAFLFFAVIWYGVNVWNLWKKKN